MFRARHADAAMRDDELVSNLLFRERSRCPVGVLHQYCLLSGNMCVCACVCFLICLSRSGHNPGGAILGGGGIGDLISVTKMPKSMKRIAERYYIS